MLESEFLPGYQQVESFGADEEYEEVGGDIDEEFEYITLDLGVVEPTLVPSTSAYRLIGLDTSNPYLQLSGSIFKGVHKRLLGSELILTDVTDASGAQAPISCLGITERRICFKEVELKEKSRNSTESDAHSARQNSSKYKPHTVAEVVGNESAVLTRRRGKPRGDTGKESKSLGRESSQEKGGEPRGATPEGNEMDTREG